MGPHDWSGMGILRALRNVFADARAWEPGYALLLQSLREVQGHAPLESDKQGPAPLNTTGCPYADNVLIPELRVTGRFVDQEVVSLETI